MIASHQLRPDESLGAFLILGKTLTDRGWTLFTCGAHKDTDFSYGVARFDKSRRRNKKHLRLSYDNLPAIEALAELITRGHDEKTIEGALTDTPTVADYDVMRQRLRSHGCGLGCKMDFARFVIGYCITFNEQELLFNEWHSVGHVADLLDAGNPAQAASSAQADQPQVNGGRQP